MSKDADFQPLFISINALAKDGYRYQLRSATDDTKIFLSMGSDQDVFTVCPPFDKVKLIDVNGATEIVPWSGLELEIRSTSS
jgi:hypothetical protein